MKEETKLELIRIAADLTGTLIQEPRTKKELNRSLVTGVQVSRNSNPLEILEIIYESLSAIMTKEERSNDTTS